MLFNFYFKKSVNVYLCIGVYVLENIQISVSAVLENIYTHTH